MRVFKVFFYLSFIALIGCFDNTVLDPVNVQPTMSEKTTPYVFDHSVFDGVTQICLPYIDDTSVDANSKIKISAGEAGFRVTHRHRHVQYEFSIGNKENGAQVWAADKLGDHKGRWCGSKFRNMNAYPTIAEFTKWLNEQDSKWVLIGDNLKRVQPSILSAMYCKNENTEFEQGLLYAVNVHKDLISPSSFQVSVTGSASAIGECSNLSGSPRKSH